MTAPALMLLHRDPKGLVKTVPFCYEDGAPLHLVEEVANYLFANNLLESWGEGVSADRLRIILENRIRIATLGEVIEHQQRIITKFRESVGLNVQEAIS